MALTGLETSVVAVVAGAIIGFVPSYLMDVRRERSLIRSRWDNSLFELCSDFASTARGVQELCLRHAGNETEARLYDAIDEEHRRLRAVSERLRLLGDLELQLAVRLSDMHTPCARCQRVDPIPGKMSFLVSHLTRGSGRKCRASMLQRVNNYR